MVFGGQGRDETIGDDRISSIIRRLRRRTMIVWERWQSLKKVLRSVLKTAVDLLEQSERVSGKMRDRVNQGVDRAGDRFSDLRHQAHDLYGHEDHTVRNVVSLFAGVGVGIGLAILFAPASGEQVRNSITERAQAMGDRVRDRVSSKRKPARAATKGVSS